VYSSRNVAEALIVKDSIKQVFGDKSEMYAKEPRIRTRIPSAEEFSKIYQKAKDQYGLTAVVDYKESRNYIEIFLYSVLPFLLLILFFVFMNRRMANQWDAEAVEEFLMSASPRHNFSTKAMLPIELLSEMLPAWQKQNRKSKKLWSF
jgi:ATP-dependent Zn protease